MISRTKDFYTIQEFSDYLGCSYKTIYNGIRNGHIVAFKVGKGRGAHYRIAHTEIQRMGLFNMEDILGEMIDRKLKQYKIID